MQVVRTVHERMLPAFADGNQYCCNPAEQCSAMSGVSSVCLRVTCLHRYPSHMEPYQHLHASLYAVTARYRECAARIARALCSHPAPHRSSQNVCNMGNSQSADASVAASAPQSSPQCPAVPSADGPSTSSCPVPERYRNPAIYNVYSQRIDGPPAAGPSLPAVAGADVLDPKNNMPLEANQQPCPGQRKPLSTDRMQSNIPKGGTDSTWLYPSPQMFFNGGWLVPCCQACSSPVAGADTGWCCCSPQTQGQGR
jgi:hypothetical protein